MTTKKIVFLAAFIALAAFAWKSADFAASSNKSYYTGDAVSFRGELIVGSTNMGSAELFRLQGDNLEKISTIKVLSKNLVGVDKGERFHDIMFNIENGRLFAYLVDGRFFYKYDVTDLSSPELVKTVKDNAWDWFNGLEKYNNRVVTIGAKGVKVWSQDMVVVDSYMLKNRYSANNLIVDSEGRYLINASSTDVEVFDTLSRSVTRKFPIDSAEEHNRTPVMNKSGVVYVADDGRVRSYDQNGHQISSYDHKGTRGYDAQLGPVSGDLYVSDGIGVLRLDPVTLKELDWKHTASLAVPGGWSMGMKVVSDGTKERVVVFNNTAIIVMDEKLELAGYYKSTEENIPEESMSLVLDKYSGMSGFMVEAKGTGFGSNEDLEVSFGALKTKAWTDKYGRFASVLTVPDVQKGMIDVKVKGLQSGLTYSVSFSVVK